MRQLIRKVFVSEAPGTVIAPTAVLPIRDRPQGAQSQKAGGIPFSLGQRSPSQRRVAFSAEQCCHLVVIPLLSLREAELSHVRKARIGQGFCMWSLEGKYCRGERRK